MYLAQRLFDRYFVFTISERVIELDSESVSIEELENKFIPYSMSHPDQ